MQSVKAQANFQEGRDFHFQAKTTIFAVIMKYFHTYWCYILTGYIMDEWTSMFYMRHSHENSHFWVSYLFSVSVLDTDIYSALSKNKKRQYNLVCLLTISSEILV